jgi:hypothetical protein
MRARVWATAGAIAVVAVVPWFVWWSRLPDPMATHWSLGGHPNGHLTRLLALTVLAGVACALALGLVLAVRQLAAPVLAFVGVVIAGASFGTVLANRDVSTWRSARDVFPVVGLSLIAAVGAAWMVRPARGAEGPAPSAPTLAVRPGERVAWTGTLHSALMVRVAIALVVLAGALFFVNVVGALVALLAVFVVSTFASTTVVVSERGVRVHGALAFARISIPRERIASASAIEVNPLEWGGWGYRGSLRFMKRGAWVVRRGPGLRLDLVDGAVFVVTIDDAATAASLVNGLLPTSTPR